MTSPELTLHGIKILSLLSYSFILSLISETKGIFFLSIFTLLSFSSRTLTLNQVETLSAHNDEYHRPEKLPQDQDYDNSWPEFFHYEVKEFTRPISFDKTWLQFPIELRDFLSLVHYIIRDKAPLFLCYSFLHSVYLIFPVFCLMDILLIPDVIL